METKPPIPLAVLVGIQTPDVDDVAHEASLEELGRLVKTLGYEVVGIIVAKARRHRRRLAPGQRQVGGAGGAHRWHRRGRLDGAAAEIQGPATV